MDYRCFCLFNMLVKSCYEHGVGETPKQRKLDSKFCIKKREMMWDNALGHYNDFPLVLII